MISYFKRLFEARYILSYLVKLDLKNKYRNSLFGFAWNFLTPLGLVLIIGIVYSTLFKTEIRDFIPYLFSGLIPWLYISGCADVGTYSFISAQGYIKQMSTPIEIYPLRLALVNLINFLMSVCAYLVICIFLKPEVFSSHLLGIIPATLIYLMFGTTWATFSGFAQVYAKDYAPFQSLVLQGLFYATPIIYPAENILETPMGWVVRYNPLYYFLEIMRRPIMGEPILNPNAYTVCVSTIIIMFALTLVLYKRVGRKIAYKL